MKSALNRCFLHFIFKWTSVIVASFIFLRIFAYGGFAGISILALVCAIINQSNSLFIGQMVEMGDDKDMASAAVTAIISSPMMTIITMVLLGLSPLNIRSIFDLLIPL